MKRIYITVALGLLALSAADGASSPSKSDTLVVAGPRTPESLDEEYPPTEAGHEARRNIYERLLAYASKPDESGTAVENFDVIVGALAEKWELSPDKKTITFTLRKGAKNGLGDERTDEHRMESGER